MTWSARTTRPDGTIPEGKYNACGGCKHAPNPDNNYKGTCYVERVAGNIGSILTSVDTGADGHMASGSADLKCSGFEAVA